MSRYDAARRRRLMDDPGIVRNRLKIAAFMDNARAYLEIRRQPGDFAAYIWSFTDGRSLRRRPAGPAGVRASSPISDTMSQDLKRRGFRFVGSTICYAFMQAVGIVDEHQRDCWVATHRESLTGRGVRRCVNPAGAPTGAVIAHRSFAGRVGCHSLFADDRQATSSSRWVLRMCARRQRARLFLSQGSNGSSNFAAVDKR